MMVITGVIRRVSPNSRLTEIGGTIARQIDTQAIAEMSGGSMVLTIALISQATGEMERVSPNSRLIVIEGMIAGGIR